MKRIRLTAVATAAVMAASTAWVLAEDKAPDVSAFDQHYAQMQAQMQAMHEQMSKLAQTKDPAERQKLLQQHWQSMQSAMQSMRGFWGAGPMGQWAGRGMADGGMGGGHMGGGHMGGGPGMMNWGNAGGYYEHMSPEQAKRHRYMSDQFMGMQQQMMEQMLEHQQWMFQSAPAAKGKDK